MQKRRSTAPAMIGAPLAIVDIASPAQADPKYRDAEVARHDLHDMLTPNELGPTYLGYSTGPEGRPVVLVTALAGVAEADRTLGTSPHCAGAAYLRFNATLYTTIYGGDHLQLLEETDDTRS